MRRGVLVTVVTAFLTAITSHAVLAECAPDRLELRGDWGSARFNVAVADTPETRAQGLMHVPSMPRNAGMLFVYERPQRASFWMENTLIPLDMLFADASGVITRIHENAIPLDRTPIPGGPAVQYVLEINGGLSARLGISLGTEMRHPAISQETAAWPCVAE